MLQPRSLDRTHRALHTSLVLSLMFAINAAVQLATAATVPVGLAAMGDSLSDGNTTAGSWVPYLANLRGLNFGPGQAYNVAVGGATSASLLTQNQHTDVAGFVAAGNVDLAFLFIGGNDFLASAVGVANGTLTGANLTNRINGWVTNIGTAASTVLAENPRGMLLVSMPEVTLAPGGRATFNTQVKIDRGRAAIDQTNVGLRALAETNNIAFVDIAGVMRDHLAGTSVTIGGVPIDLVNSGSQADRFFQDPIHPGTVGNGLLANLMITALNKAYDADITPFTDLEILTAAGIANRYTGETLGSTLDYAAYVTAPVAPPSLVGDANGDCAVGAADYAIWAAQFGQTTADLSSDFDQNGSVGAGDYTLWAANFGNTCLPAGTRAAQVPEPSAMALALVAIAVGMVCRGRPGVRAG